MEHSVALRLRITGRVQGVGYRDWAMRQAMALDLAGWVRNRADGSVEALVSGRAEDVELFVTRAREGPRLAHVDDVLSEPDEAPTDEDFRCLPTL
jgi:acylphosphatase